jgi:hypothetical protein
MDLKTSISLKDLDYRVTSPWRSAYKFRILVGDMHFDFEIKRGRLIIYNLNLGTYKLNDTNWSKSILGYVIWKYQLKYHFLRNVE